MPIVPGQRGQVTSIPSVPRVDPTYLAMAAATMHEQGRLFEPPPLYGKLKEGQFAYPAQITNVHRTQSGLSKEDAAKETLKSMREWAKDAGDDPDESIANIPGS